MADLLAAGAAWLAGQLKSHAGQTVSYARGQDTLEELTATPARGERPADVFIDDQVGKTVAAEQDWLLTAADLVLPLAGATVPERGDRITWVTGGKSLCYEVLPPSSSEDVYRYSDPQRTILRVHSKLVSEVASGQ